MGFSVPVEVSSATAYTHKAHGTSPKRGQKEAQAVRCKSFIYKGEAAPMKSQKYEHLTKLEE